MYYSLVSKNFKEIIKRLEVMVVVVIQFICNNSMSFIGWCISLNDKFLRLCSIKMLNSIISFIMMGLVGRLVFRLFGSCIFVEIGMYVMSNQYNGLKLIIVRYIINKIKGKFVIKQQLLVVVVNMESSIIVMKFSMGVFLVGKLVRCWWMVVSIVFGIYFL